MAEDIQVSIKCLSICSCAYSTVCVGLFWDTYVNWLVWDVDVGIKMLVCYAYSVHVYNTITY